MSRWFGEYTPECIPDNEESHLWKPLKSTKGGPRAVGRNFVLADGKRLFLGGSAPGGLGDSSPSASK